MKDMKRLPTHENTLRKMCHISTYETILCIVNSYVEEGKHTPHEVISHLAITCSKLTIETLKQGVKYVQS